MVKEAVVRAHEESGAIAKVERILIRSGNELAVAVEGGGGEVEVQRFPDRLAGLIEDQPLVAAIPALRFQSHDIGAGERGEAEL